MPSHFLPQIHRTNFEKVNNDVKAIMNGPKAAEFMIIKIIEDNNIKPNYTEKYCSLLSIDKKNITIINNKLNSLNILSNAKISTRTIAVIYYLFLNDRKLSDVCKICNVGISSVKSFYKLLQ
jgi:hypothetical protein